MSAEDNSLMERIVELVEQMLAKWDAEQPVAGQLLYPQRQAAKIVGISLSSLEILINRREIKLRHWGSRVLIPREELERIAKKDFLELWPPKDADGKTRRQIGGDKSREKETATGCTSIETRR